MPARFLRPPEDLISYQVVPGPESAPLLLLLPLPNSSASYWRCRFELLSASHVSLAREKVERPWSPIEPIFVPFAFLLSATSSLCCVYLERPLPLPRPPPSLPPVPSCVRVFRFPFRRGFPGEGGSRAACGEEASLTDKGALDHRDEVPATSIAVSVGTIARARLT